MILVIEAKKNISLQFNERLDYYKLEYKIANNGVEAYKIICDPLIKIDYLITNIGLPDETGVEIIKFIKKKFDSKIIVYTNKDYDQYKNKIHYDYFYNKKNITPINIIDMIFKNLI